MSRKNNRYKMCADCQGCGKRDALYEDLPCSTCGGKGTVERTAEDLIKGAIDNQRNAEALQQAKEELRADVQAEITKQPVDDFCRDMFEQHVIAKYGNRKPEFVLERSPTNNHDYLLMDVQIRWVTWQESWQACRKFHGWVMEAQKNG